MFVINIIYNFYNYINYEGILIYIFYIFFKNRSFNILIPYSLFLLFFLTLDTNYISWFIFIELFTIISYFIIISSKPLANIYIFYLILNLFSTIYFLSFLLYYNTYFDFSFFVPLDYLVYFFYFKLGIFPFHGIIYYIYRFLTVSNLYFMSIFPKIVFFNLLSLLPSLNNIYSLLTMLISIKYINTFKIRTLIISNIIFNSGFLLYINKSNYLDYLFIYNLHLVLLFFYLLNSSLGLFTFFWNLSYLGIPPFLGFYKYLYIYIYLSDPTIFLVFFLNLLFSLSYFKFFLLSTFSSSKSFSILPLFFLIYLF